MNDLLVPIFFILLLFIPDIFINLCSSSYYLCPSFFDKKPAARAHMDYLSFGDLIPPCESGLDIRFGI